MNANDPQFSGSAGKFNLNNKTMEDFEKILVLDNEFEAERMEEVLMDKQIPYGIIIREDSALGGIIDLEEGWGYLEAPARFRDDIMKIYKEIREASTEPEEGEV